MRLGLNELKANERYTNRVSNKNCPFCDEVENEIHFFLYCPLYKKVRDKYIVKHVCREMELDPLKFLLQNENELITRDVAMFIYYGLRLRENSLS